MPDKLRAGGSFPYILADDRNETNEPQFDIAILSAEDNSVLLGIRDEFLTADRRDHATRLDKQSRMVDMVVKSVRIEGYGKPDLPELLTDSECWELISAAINGAALTPEERKKFVLPPPSETESSANDVEAVTA